MTKVASGVNGEKRITPVVGTYLLSPNREQASPGPWWLTTVVGFVVGVLVSITSVGSGTLIIASLVFLYPATPLKKLVGSDIFHALFLVGVSALGHAGLGTNSWPACSLDLCLGFGSAAN